MKKMLVTFALLSSYALADIQKYIDGDNEYVVMLSFWSETGWSVQPINDQQNGEGFKLSKNGQTVQIFQKDFAVVNGEKVSLNQTPYRYFGQFLMRSTDVLNIFQPPEELRYQLLDYKTGVVLNPKKPKAGGFFGEAQILTPPKLDKPVLLTLPNDVLTPMGAESRGFLYINSPAPYTPLTIYNSATSFMEVADIKAEEFASACQRDLTPKLLSPATASYAGWSKPTYSVDGVFTVYGKVDAQNAYGALIRGDYVCRGIVYAYKVFLYANTLR